VIATLWPISDAIAAAVTDRVYNRLCPRESAELAPALAATALHSTVHALRRRYPDDPTRWASYVHFGP
jgi:CHAT domain-containing protein